MKGRAVRYVDKRDAGFGIATRAHPAAHGDRRVLRGSAAQNFCASEKAHVSTSSTNGKANLVWLAAVAIVPVLRPPYQSCLRVVSIWQADRCLSQQGLSGSNLPSQ